MPVYPSTAAARTISTVIAELMHNSAHVYPVSSALFMAPGPVATMLR